MRVLELQSCNRSNGALGLFFTLALLAPWLSSLPGVWMPLAGTITAVVFALALEDDRALPCNRLLVGHRGLMAVYHHHAWHAVSRWRLVRSYVYRIELSVQTEEQSSKQRFCLSQKNMLSKADYAVLRYYLLSATDRKLKNTQTRLF